MRRLKICVCGIFLFACADAGALDFKLGDNVNLALNNRLSAGIAWRMQDRSPRLIGKLNIPGQSHLCDADNCLSLNGDPAPNQRLVDAPGAFSGVNSDDGDLNYDKHDIVAATTKLTSDALLQWGEHFLLRVRGIGFYDPANINFDEKHNDTRFQPATTKRPKSVEKVFAKGANLLDAYAQYTFEYTGRTASIAAGNQTVRWGESTLIALNSLFEINPPNAAILRMPGVEISELFQPVPVVLFSTDIVKNVSAEFVYQFGWKPVVPDPRGSFFADSDLIGGTNAYISLGQFGEDPDRRFRAASTLGFLTSTTLTTYLLPPTEPKNGGQYGMRLNYFADWLNGGTETSFYYLNYHSRLPYATVLAANDSCARNSSSIPQAYQDCNGFNGSQNFPQPNPGRPRGEPLPIDTLKAYLDYPENIHMFGFSFNTNLGSFSLAGEFSYRPNVPIQVQINDVVFMGLQPAFPANELKGPPCAPPCTNDFQKLLSSDFPSAEQAVPSYLRTYRGVARVAANSLIKGYERMRVGQFDFTAIKAVSTNPFGADQIIFINEAGGTVVFGMPPRDKLQFEGGGPYRTHASAGADGTGTPDGKPDPRHLNPTQQTHGFADHFAWGVRSITRFEYNDVVFGWGFRPTIIFSWDIHGIAPYPLQNFVEGRKEIVAGTDVNITQALSARALYQWFTGGGQDNTRKDRDNLALSLSYTF